MLSILPQTVLDWDLQSPNLHSIPKESICFELRHNKLIFAVLSQAFVNKFPFLSSHILDITFNIFLNSGIT